MPAKVGFGVITVRQNIPRLYSLKVGNSVSEDCAMGLKNQELVKYGL